MLTVEQKFTAAQMIAFALWWRSPESDRAMREDCGEHALREWVDHAALAPPLSAERAELVKRINREANECVPPEHKSTITLLREAAAVIERKS